MKLTQPPREPSELEAEKKIIEERLGKLFSHSFKALRQIPSCCKGSWIEEQRHVKLNSNRGIYPYLIKHSAKLNYDYLDSFEALFCLESNQLMIYCDDIPLSLAEAYHLLLKNEDDSREYSVFKHLNRTGFICLYPDGQALPREPVDRQANIADKSFSEKQQCGQAKSSNEAGLLLESCLFIDEINLNQVDALGLLRCRGPIDGSLSSGVWRSDEIRVTFHIYKRENFGKNKPRKGIVQGYPDYLLVVVDYVVHVGIDCKQILELEKYSKLLSGEKSAIPVIFALVDCENSICFTQFKSPTIDSLEVAQIDITPAHCSKLCKKLPDIKDALSK